MPSMPSHGPAAVTPTAAGDAYDRFSYPGFAYPATHPGRLETLGRLFGLTPAAAVSCRVLELGCGDGGNALSIAQSLPGASVIGIDAAATAIARGMSLLGAAGLENVELRCEDLERLPEDLGSFDYIVAHGVYSWIPPRVRSALLACCRARLNPAGIAFISYNAYPGSYLRDMARDILRYHLRNVEDPQERLDAAHTLMRTMVAIEEPTPYARVLREHMQRMLRASDALLLHDDLAEISTPFYFHEFMENAASHGLAFLSEADLFESQLRDVPESVEALLGSLPGGVPDDVLAREQYLDFFKNRMFRQTLLCHAEAPVRRELDDHQLERLAISAAVSVAKHDDSEETFLTPEGLSMTTSEPLVRAAMRALSEAWPAALNFPTLLERAIVAVGPGASSELVAARLRSVLLQAYVARIVQLRGSAPAVSPEPGERPRTGALTRAQCAAGSVVVSSLLHTNVRLEGELEPRLLALLDGTRDRKALSEALGDPAEGGVTASSAGSVSSGESASSAVSPAALESALERFASVGLLTGVG
jgi:methyltransferase-like protein